MIPEEAAWMRQVIDEVKPESILDCGSSSALYRQQTQPHIDAKLFVDRAVTHLDVNPAPGVDITADICEAINLPKYTMAVCASLLEHVRDHALALENVCRAVESHLLLSVPNRWPPHGGYDNGYRPSLGGLCDTVETRGLTVHKAELLNGSGRYSGRRIAVLHAMRE